MMARRLVPLLAAVLLGACASSNVEEPAELVDFEQQARFEQVWDYSLSDDGDELLLGLKPAYDGTRVYAADHAGTVVAIDAQTGKQVWRVKTDGGLFGDEGLAFSAGPAVADGRVAVATENGEILVLDSVDGSQLWQRKIDADILVSPLIEAGRVLVRTGDGRLMVFDLETGNLAWDTVREMPLLTVRGQSQPAVKDSNVFVAWDNGNLASLDLATGSMNWETAIGQPVGVTEVQQMADIDGDVVAFGAEIYVAGHNTNLAALAEESGEILWREELSAVRGPAVSYGSVVITDINSVLRAYDRLAGTSLWTQDVLRARYLTAPTLWQDFIAVGDLEGYLHFFDRTSGKMLARIRHDGEPVNARPLAIGDKLVVLSADGELAAYRHVESND